MTEWRDAEEVPVQLPDKVPDWRETVSTRTGLRIELQWDGRRERTELLEVRDLSNGQRALLTIVNTHRPADPSRRIRTAWVYWDPNCMQLSNPWHRGATATAEIVRHEGDAHRIRVGEMLDCFTGDWTTFQPHRDVEVRAGGRWHWGKLRWRHNGPTRDRAVMVVDAPFYEPEWGAPVTYKRMYRWDPRTVRPVGADQLDQI
ncbi:hypothetical protein [Streptomyces variabilis]